GGADPRAGPAHPRPGVPGQPLVHGVRPVRVPGRVPAHRARARVHRGGLMGLEARCRASFGAKSGEGMARLEEKEITFGGGAKFKIALADVKKAEARAGVLHVQTKQGEARFELGKDAEKWALKIRYPR